MGGVLHTIDKTGNLLRSLPKVPQIDTDENSAKIPCPISKKVRSPKFFGKANFKPTKERM